MHRPFTSIEPATGEPVWAGESGDADIEVAIARAAWPDWTSRAIAVRMEYMRRFANAIRARMDDFVELIARETGSPLWEARAEIEAVIAHIEPAIAAHSERTPRKRAEGALGTRHAVRHKPHGVMVVITPWVSPAAPPLRTSTTRRTARARTARSAPRWKTAPPARARRPPSAKKRARQRSAR